MNDQEEHNLHYIKRETLKRLDIKYRKGSKENDGDLLEMDIITLIDNAIDESIDQISYLQTLRRKVIHS